MAYRGEIKEVSLSATKPSDMLSVKEVAELCGITHGRVCQLLRDGIMKGQKFQKIVWQVRRREAEKFIERPTSVGRPRISEAG